MSRNTQRRDHHRKVIAKGQPPCALCGDPIDYTLRYPHPRSFVVDHKVSVHRGGTDTIDNKQPAHADCNRAKAAKVVSPIIKRSPSLRRVSVPGDGA